MCRIFGLRNLSYSWILYFCKYFENNMATRAATCKLKVSRTCCEVVCKLFPLNYPVSVRFQVLLAIQVQFPGPFCSCCLVVLDGVMWLQRLCCSETSEALPAPHNSEEKRRKWNACNWNREILKSDRIFFPQVRNAENVAKLI